MTNHEKSNSNMIKPSSWMFVVSLFRLGAVPALVVLLASLQTEDSEEFRSQHLALPAGFDRGIMKTLLGTAGAWCLYDLAFYGTTIFTPTILTRMCITGGERWPSLFVNLVELKQLVCGLILHTWIYIFALQHITIYYIDET